MSRQSPARRDAFCVWHSFSTRWADNDAYGHVNNAVYYQWFDSAVNAWLVSEGLLDLATGEPIALVAETRCSYAAPVAFPKEVDVGLAVAALGRTSIRYRIGVFSSATETAAAEGEFVHVVVDRATRRPVSIPEEWRAKLERIAR